MLKELGKELESLGFSLVRYADDAMVVNPNVPPVV